MWFLWNWALITQMAAVVQHAFSWTLNICVVGRCRVENSFKDKFKNDRRPKGSHSSAPRHEVWTLSSLSWVDTYHRSNLKPWVTCQIPFWAESSCPLKLHSLTWCSINRQLNHTGSCYMPTGHCPWDHNYLLLIFSYYYIFRNIKLKENKCSIVTCFRRSICMVSLPLNLTTDCYILLTHTLSRSKNLSKILMYIWALSVC